MGKSCAPVYEQHQGPLEHSRGSTKILAKVITRAGVPSHIFLLHRTFTHIVQHKRHFYRPPLANTTAMAERGAEEFNEPFQVEAEAFIKQKIRKNRGIPDWNDRMPDQHSQWLKSTHFLRGCLHPTFFAYANRRGNGQEPPPDQYTWPEKSEERRKFERDVRRRGKLKFPP